MIHGTGPSKISDFDQKRVGEILRGEGDWFSAHLLRLLAKCDGDNLEALRTLYPEHVDALERWRQRGDDQL